MVKMKTLKIYTKHQRNHWT